MSILFTQPPFHIQSLLEHIFISTEGCNTQFFDNKPFKAPLWPSHTHHHFVSSIQASLEPSIIAIEPINVSNGDLQKKT